MLRIRPVLFLLTLPLFGIAAAFAAENPVQTSGKYAVELRLPAEGVHAGEEVSLPIRVTDTARRDSVPGVARAKIAGSITLPAMPGMPKIRPAIRAEGVPGDYGLVTTFPHGGSYRVELTIIPPGEDRPFSVVFPLEVRDARAAGTGDGPAAFQLEVIADPPRPVAGRPATLTLTVLARDTDAPVTNFDLLDDERLHLLLVREDLGALFSERPAPGRDGRFTLSFTFPSGGDWRLFAEVAPQGAGAQTLSATLAVDGPHAMRSLLVPAIQPVVRQSGMTLTMRPMNLTAGKTLPLVFTLTDTAGRPLTDLLPWRGVLAHLFLIERDSRTLVHAYPDPTDLRHGRNGGLVFLARFPRPGIWRGWAQLQRGSLLHTLPLVLRVTENR